MNSKKKAPELNRHEAAIAAQANVLPFSALPKYVSDFLSSNTDGRQRHA